VVLTKQAYIQLKCWTLANSVHGPN